MATVNAILRCLAGKSDALHYPRCGGCSNDPLCSRIVAVIKAHQNKKEGINGK